MREFIKNYDGIQRTLMKEFIRILNEELLIPYNPLELNVTQRQIERAGHSNLWERDKKRYEEPQNQYYTVFGDKTKYTP